MQNRYTPNDPGIKLTTWKSWKTCRKNNADLVVHLQVESIKEKSIVWQEGAPVHTVLYDSPHISVGSVCNWVYVYLFLVVYVQLQTDALVMAVDLYKKDLKIYGHKGIPRFHRSKSFSDRIDQNLMLLCRECPKLHTLVSTKWSWN